MIAGLIGLIPLLTAALMCWLWTPVINRMTLGMQPGDVRISGAAWKLFRLSSYGHFRIVPLLALFSMIAFAIFERHRGRNWTECVALLLVAAGVSAASWFLGFVLLAATIWNA